ncbi:MAG: 6-phospho-beta-glucosidase [Anaerolineales bacterium]
MDPLNIAIIGAGSSYTPEIIEEIHRRRERFPVNQITFMDINPKRLEIMLGFCKRFAAHLGCEIEIKATDNRKEAISDAQFILTQIRVGGNAQRILDEKIPLKHGVIGQETTGPGGMFKALRTIPPMLEIAQDIEKISPNAWIINYANPTGMIAEAVTKYSSVKIAGLCAGGNFPRDHAIAALGVAPQDVFYNYFGLNHLNFGYNLRVKGLPLSDTEYDKVLEHATWGSVQPELIHMLQLVPSPYLQYYFHRESAVRKAQEKPLTRGEQVQLIEKEVFDAYADPSQVSKPEALNKRGGGGYSNIALDVMEAAFNNDDKCIVINTANQGAVAYLPDDAVIEVPCMVNASGIFPLRQPDVPQAVWGLIAAVKNYEQLAVEAAVTGDRDTALLALLAHPLVGDYAKAKAILADMMEANRQYLPQFYP